MTGDETIAELREKLRKRDVKIDEMARGHDRLNGALLETSRRLHKAEERIESQRRIIDALRAGREP